mmetsp:Transcript_53103/g.153177  ORF Transcript_53103/g.153177 Transcript_53103/m.153177 type:complete len:945 (+) Transcript_53103:120-2954(+)|eukprot:CAMPEP_0176091856 /NCGR_PEP_ID=MMETSP0120_2-20121206/46012_1 /TAXON_ID=160619 /ORGANISM="Kryptoperidinium foliaceum, Strain CCMP 1326" /LENGTH=944 /DNA_ID=CAMNT_0017425757 /DNA_START=77 /DNA_END=2911 /DNA_ORIENTATION=-
MAESPGEGPAPLEKLFEQLAREHLQFLAAVAQSAQALQREERLLIEDAFSKLYRENAELNEELCELRRIGIRRVVDNRRCAPPVPQVPQLTDADGPDAAKQPFFTVADISGALPPSSSPWRSMKAQSSPTGTPVAHTLQSTPSTSAEDELQDVQSFPTGAGGGESPGTRNMALRKAAMLRAERAPSDSPPDLGEQDLVLEPAVAPAMSYQPKTSFLQPRPPTQLPNLTDSAPLSPAPIMPGVVEEPLAAYTLSQDEGLTRSWRNPRPEASMIAQPTNTGIESSDLPIFGAENRGNRGSRATATTDIAPVTLAPANNIKDKMCRKQRLRLRYLLGLSGKDKLVSADDLYNFLLKRYPDCGVSIDAVEAVVKEFKRVHSQEAMRAIVRGSHASDSSMGPEGYIAPHQIELRVLVDMLVSPDILRHCCSEVRDDVDTIVKGILKVTVDEVIDNATMMNLRREADNSVQDRALRMCPSSDAALNILVTATVLFNIFCLGISLDIAPSNKVWYIIEIVCACVFVSEVVVKMRRHGVRKYFHGEDRIWNSLDLLLTLLAILDVCFTTMNMVVPGLMGDNKGSYAAQMVLMLRAMRLTRVVRLVKLLRSPLLQNLTNMLTGFMLGLPALFWVVVLFLVVLYVFGLAFRIMWGPAEGQNMIAVCGVPDDVAEGNGNPTAECISKLHWLYGEEFFGTVWLSMFTTFRFMLGDYQSRNGVSLAIVFGERYGAAFHVLFGVGMILAVFGLFNIVTAIFVDSTISGLKHNDAMRKYALQYEGRYVKGKIQKLLERIGELMIEAKKDAGGNATSRCSTTATARLRVSGSDTQDAFELCESIVLTSDDFCEVMEDLRVRSLLRDLDVEMYNPQGFFETFDADDSGTVTILEMVQAIMRLRGDVRKNDLIASWVAVRALGRRFDQLTLALSAGLEHGHKPPRESLGKESLDRMFAEDSA